MLKNKSTKTMDETKFLEEEYAAYKQYRDNDEFFDFADNNREEVYNLLESRVEKTVDMLDDGIVVLFEYCMQDSDFNVALAVYTEVYANQCRKYEDRQKSIEELWRAVITYAVSKEVHGIPEDDGPYMLFERSLFLPLYKYLWEDFQKIKQNEESV